MFMRRNLDLKKKIKFVEIFFLIEFLVFKEYILFRFYIYK